MTPSEFETLAPGGHSLFMAGLPEGGGAGGPRQARARNSDEATSLAAAWGKAGMGVFYTPCRLKDGETRRCAENMVSAACLWVDIDKIPAEDALHRIRQGRHQPTRAYTSGGGAHLYFDLVEPVPAGGELVEALKLLAGFYGGDPAVCEPARLMRLPGTLNHKYPDKPEVRLIHQRAGKFEFSDVVDWMLEDAPVAPPPAAPRANGHAPTDPFAAVARNERMDVDAALDAMAYPGNVHDTQTRAALSMTQNGVPVEDIVARLMEATKRAAGAEGAKWDWTEEELTIRKGAIGSAFKRLNDEYDPATGEIPRWVPPEMHPKWGTVLTEGGRPRVVASRSGSFHVMDAAKVPGRPPREATGVPTAPARAPQPTQETHTSEAPEEPTEKVRLDLGAPKGGPAPSGGMFDDWTPYVAPNEATIPRRQWLYGKHYLRGTVSASVGAPGRLKSTTTQTEALAMVIDRDLMHGNGDDEHGELRVAYLNGEEGQDELDRRHLAMCKHYNVPESAYAGRLWIKSTRDRAIRLAETDAKARPVINEKVVAALKAWCDANYIDVLIVDPLISFHSVRENANEDMDLLCKQGFGRIAGNGRAVELVHHPRKSAPGEVNTTVEDMRGASSVLAAVRTARTFNFMTSTEASQLRINEDERRSYVRIENGKGGPGPLGKARWAKIMTKNLINGDTVAVAAQWKPPDNFTTVDPAHTQAVIVYALQGSWRVDARSPEWLGWKVIEILGLKARPGKTGKISNTEKADRDRAAAALQIWEESGVLSREERLEGAQRKTKEFYVAGPKADASDPLPLAGED